MKMDLEIKKILDKISVIRYWMEIRTNQKITWKRKELYNKFDDWENHGKTWELDHIHPVFLKEKYNGDINSLDNIQKLSIEEHKEKTKLENIISNKNSGIKKSKKTNNEIYNVIEDWDFNQYGNITQKKVAELTGKSLRTIKTYWNDFKDYVETLNNDNTSDLSNDNQKDIQSINQEEIVQPEAPIEVRTFNGWIEVDKKYKDIVEHVKNFKGIQNTFQKHYSIHTLNNYLDELREYYKK